MRRLSSPVVVVALLLSSAGLAAAQTPSAREIVDRHLAARGGAEKLRAVTAIRMKGEVGARGMATPITLTVKRPNLVRQELEVQGQQIIQAFDGERAWMVNPIVGMKTPTEVPSPPGGRPADSFDGLLLDFEQRGTRMEVVGPATVGETDTWHLRAQPREGPSQNVFISAETWLEVKTTVRLEQDGQSVEIETYLDDYREVGGIKFPHLVRVAADGETQQEMTILSIELLDKLDDAFFVMPKPAER